MANKRQRLWVQFAKTGDPNRECRQSKRDNTADRILHFTNSGVVVAIDPLKPSLDLWQRIGRRR